VPRGLILLVEAGYLLRKLERVGGLEVYFNVEKATVPITKVLRNSPLVVVVRPL
jgi:hypothetical protein